MGTVYKARHTRLKRIVALKVLPKDRLGDEQAVARFQREMEAVGRLDHPNIVRAMDAREDRWHSLPGDGIPRRSGLVRGGANAAEHCGSRTPVKRSVRRLSACNVPRSMV